MTANPSSGTPSRRAALWMQSGLLDVEFYAALRGRRFVDAQAAAEDFVEHGMRRRLSPHPFLDFVSLPAEARRAWRQGRVQVLLRLLAGDDGRPSLAGPLAGTPDPAPARARMLELAGRLGAEPDGVGSTSVAVDWDVVRRQPRTLGRTSVVVVATTVRRTVRLVESVWHSLPEAVAPQVEVVVVDPGTPPHVALSLYAALGDHPAARIVRLPGPVPRAAALNTGIAGATGDVVALLDPQFRLGRDFWHAVLGLRDDPDVAGVQPVLLGADDMIESAGLAVPAEGAAPVPLLAGHPREDAQRLRGHRLGAVSGDVMVLRADDVVTLGGLNPGMPWPEAAIDLCARLVARRTGGFRVAPTAVARRGRTSDPPEATAWPPHADLPSDPGVAARIGLATAMRDRPEQLRWSLKLPSPAGARGDAWGDTHFADALAVALRGLGQDVVTRRRGAHAAGPTHLDDVSLALRGMHPIPPTPGQLNVLWVISHPDEVDPGEFEGYDLVCAASARWSAEMSERSGREVVPLLQASSFRRPASGPPRAPEAPGVVFVGSTDARRHRALVWQAVEAGVPLAVYGRGWGDLPAGIWRGEYVDNRRLPEVYHDHGIVLADHWPDMARHGFIANRVFDAVSAGARVICDDVVGVHDVFDPHDVVVARTPEEIVEAVALLSRQPRPADLPRPSLSFHDRARTLLDLVRNR